MENYFYSETASEACFSVHLHLVPGVLDTSSSLQHQSKQNKIEQNQKESAKAFPGFALDGIKQNWLQYTKWRGEVRVEQEASNKE